MSIVVERARFVEACDRVDEILGHAIATRSNDRHALFHCLRQRDGSAALFNRSQHENIRFVEEVLGRLDETREQYALADTEAAGQAAILLEKVALVGDYAGEIHPAVLQVADRVQEKDRDLRRGGARP